MNKDIKNNTTSQYISDYLTYLEMERGLSKNTILAYQSDLADFFEFLGEVNLEDIKRKTFYKSL